jgi:hypothetical protein
MPKTQKTPRAEEESIRCFLIRDYYRGLGDELQWDLNRYRRLAFALRLTEAELAALIRMSSMGLRGAIKRNRFPAMAELHLTLLERSVFPSNQPPVFPPIL